MWRLTGDVCSGYAADVVIRSEDLAEIYWTKVSAYTFVSGVDRTGRCRILIRLPDVDERAEL